MDRPGLACDLLGDAHRVHVGGVAHVDPALKREVEHLPGGVAVDVAENLRAAGAEGNRRPRLSTMSLPSAYQSDTQLESAVMFGGYSVRLYIEQTES